MNARLLLLLPALCVLAFAPIAADEQRPGGAAASITIDELRDHMFYLASDALQGRSSGTAGYDIAAWYAAAQFRNAGLQPAFMDDQGKPGYLQKIPLRKTYKTDKNQLNLTINGATNTYRIPGDYGLMYFGKSLGDLPAAGVVFIGYGIHEPSSNWDDYAGVDVKGKYVIMLMGAPKKADGSPALSVALDKKYGNIRMSIMPKFMTLKAMGGAGIIVLPTPETARSYKGMMGFVSSPQISVWKEGGQEFNPLAFIDIPIILVQDALAEAIVAGRPFNPMTGEGNYGSFALEGIEIGLNVDIASERVDTWNVGGIVPGTDENLKKEFITIGAHLDHVGGSGEAVFNGADDNASGSVAVIEAAEATAITPARRSTLFLLYAAEEIGIVGSKYFVDNSPIPTADMVVNINMDMVGRQDDEFPQGIYVLGSEKRSAELKELLIATNEATVKLPLDFRFDQHDPESWWTRSDQVGFHNKGIPVIFFTSGDHPDYHQTTDDAEKIDFEKVRGVSQLCYEMAMTLGNRDTRPAMKAK